MAIEGGRTLRNQNLFTLEKEINTAKIRNPEPSDLLNTSSRNSRAFPSRIRLRRPRGFLGFSPKIDQSTANERIGEEMAETETASFLSPELTSKAVLLYSPPLAGLRSVPSLHERRLRSSGPRASADRRFTDRRTKRGHPRIPVTAANFFRWHPLALVFVLVPPSASNLLSFPFQGWISDIDK